MPSKFDRLRSGEVVEIEPGRKGRLNLEKKTFETSDGRTMFVGDDPDFFPSNEEGLKVSRERENLERSIKKAPAGEFLYQFGNQGIAGAAKNTMNKLMLSGDEYLRSKRVNEEVSNKISERSPWTSAGATVASMVPDIALTRGMSALKAGPVLAAAHAGPRIIEEPTQVATEAMFSAAGGHLIDKGAAALNRIAQRRGTVRALPGQQEAVREQNALGQQAVNDANTLQNQQFNAQKHNIKNVNEGLLQQHQSDLNARQNQIIQDKNAFQAAKTARENQIIQLKHADEQAIALQNQQFNFLKQNVKKTNEARLQQHQSDLIARQNQMVEEQNAYISAKSARDAEVVRLRNAAEMAKAQRSADQAVRESEYRIAKEAAETENKRFNEQFKLQQAQHQQALKDLPELQKRAQQEYSENVIKNAEGISNAFPKDSKIYSSQFGTNNFIEESINKSALAGSREASQASKILKSIMPEGEILTAKDLATRYRALEGVIQKSPPEVAAVLNEFKSNMGMQINTVLADNMAYSRIMPELRKQIVKDVNSVLDSMPLAESGLMSRPVIKRRVEGNINQLFREMTPHEFVKKIQSGEIREQILRGVIKESDFTAGLGGLNIKNARKAGTTLSPEAALALGIPPSAEQVKHSQFSSIFNSKLDNALARANLKMIAVETDAATKLGGKVKNTYGMAEPVSPPNYPSSPESVPVPQPPSALPDLPTLELPTPVAAPQKLPFLPKPSLLSSPDPFPEITPSQIPNKIAHPQHPAMPAKPNLMGDPAPTIPQAFNAVPEPTLAPAQGMLEGMGDMLEGSSLMGGNTLTNNPLTKLAGLKYLLGKGALPAELAYMGMKGLTSPTMGGEVARMTFKQGGIQAIQSWAEKYPSYQNGILQNPQERRSLTKEIEDDAEIPLEQKAILQSKVNRGKPLSQRL